MPLCEMYPIERTNFVLDDMLHKRYIKGVHTTRRIIMPTGAEKMREWRRKNPERQAEIAKRYRAKQKEKRERAKLNKPPINRAGKEPPEHYSYYGVFNHDGTDWNVSYFAPSSGWINMKLWAVGLSPIKANFWLAYSGARFAANSCYRAISENRPDMLLSFEDYMHDMIDDLGIELCCD